MCDPLWRAIEIDADGFRIVGRPPVHFRRESGMLALPSPSTIDPKKGIERLREVLRLRDKRDFVVIVAWLLAALAGRSPYAVLAFLGEPGATKTSAAYAVRSIIDPNASPLRAKPKEPHDVFVAATHSLIVGYNNLSSLPDWLSDTMCVVSEGSGESRRELFTDADESLIVACAPFLLTGIENVVKRGDLAQRTLYVHLASVPDGERLTEQTFKARFRRAHADLLGALCAAASSGLRNEKTLKLDSLPRLATFFHWASACEASAVAPRRIPPRIRRQRQGCDRGRHRGRAGSLGIPPLHGQARKVGRDRNTVAGGPRRLRPAAGQGSGSGSRASR